MIINIQVGEHNNMSPYEHKVRNKYKIQNRAIDVTANSQHKVYTIDYICDS